MKRVLLQQKHTAAPQGKPFISLCLDSGAFGAWKRGMTLDLQTYIKYVHAHKHLINSYVNMDQIPGDKGLMVRTPEAVEQSAKQSYKNLQIMKDAGLRPIPVYHQGERFHWLEQLCNDGEQYIGISPYLRSHRGEVRRWLDLVFSIITDSKGRPLVRTHGFGMTNTVLLLRYPWATCDSTSWTMSAGYGNIYVPCLTNGKSDFTKPPIIINISGGKVDAGKAFDGLGSEAYNAVVAWVESLGLSIAQVRNSSHHRIDVMVAYFKSIERMCREGITFRHRTKGLAQSTQPITGKPSDHKFTLIYACSPHANIQNQDLTRNGVTNRLLSYFDIRDKREGFVEHFVTTGLPGALRGYPRAKWDDEHYLSARRLSLASKGSQPDER